MTKNVYTPMVFYVPYDVLEYIPETLGEKLDGEGFFNSMVMIDAKGGVGTLSGSMGSLDILGKPKTLKTNYLQLVELESQIKQETFAMVIEEYLDVVSSYDFIYTWMAVNVARDIPEDNANYGSYFTLQSDCIKEHLLQITERFIGPAREKPRALNFDRIIENGKKLFPDEEGVLEVAQDKDRPQKGKQKKKMVLPKVEEVDLWLLETVFNVDFGAKKHDNTSV